MKKLKAGHFRIKSDKNQIVMIGEIVNPIIAKFAGYEGNKSIITSDAKDK